MEAPELDRGPNFLRNWAAKIAAAINANKPVAGTGVLTNESGNGIAISVPRKTPGTESGSGGDGGGGDDSGTETITGAVSGVPSTLNVLTDGAGWVEIE